jgi:hypothetical protein
LLESSHLFIVSKAGRSTSATKLQRPGYALRTSMRTRDFPEPAAADVR